jgi:serine/threonine protein kinase
MAGLSDYELDAELGRGGMGRVHRARYRPTGAVRAVKMLEGAPDPEMIERFRREARALAAAGGEGVVVVHEAGIERDRAWLAMELMPGGSLRDRLRTAGRLDWREASALGAKLARTLERCAGLGLIHRDVKPENVLFDERGEPRVADFGCVRDVTARTMTEAGALVGTPAYIAPELAQGARPDASVDVYALGVVIHELVAGTRPYDGTSPVAIITLALDGKRSKVEPPELERVIASALGPREKRPTAGELARALEELLAAKSPAPRPARSRVAPVAAAVLVLAGLAAALGVALHTPPTAPPPSPAPAVVTPVADLPKPARPAVESSRLDLRKELKAIRADRLLEVSPALEQVLFGENPLPPELKESLRQTAADGYRDGLAFLGNGPKEGPSPNDAQIEPWTDELASFLVSIAFLERAGDRSTIDWSRIRWLVSDKGLGPAPRDPQIAETAHAELLAALADRLARNFFKLRAGPPHQSFPTLDRIYGFVVRFAPSPRVRRFAAHLRLREPEPTAAQKAEAIEWLKQAYDWMVETEQGEEEFNVAFEYAVELALRGRGREATAIARRCWEKFPDAFRSQHGAAFAWILAMSRDPETARVLRELHMPEPPHAQLVAELAVKAEAARSAQDYDAIANALSPLVTWEMVHH